MLQRSKLYITSTQKVSPDVTQEGGPIPLHLAVSHCSYPCQRTPRRVWIRTEYWLQIAEVHSKGMISKSPGFVSSHTYPGSPPCLFGTVSQSYLRCYVPGLSPQFCPPNKM